MLEVEVAIRNLLNSILGKEWKQAVSHFLRLYYEMFSVSQGAVYNVCRVLHHMSKQNLQFPLGKDDNFKEIIDIFIDIDDGENGNGNGNENNHHQEAKEILLLLIATQQSNTCVDVINILVHRKGKEFIINSNFGAKGRSVLSLSLNLHGLSIEVVNCVIEVGGREMVTKKLVCQMSSGLQRLASTPSFPHYHPTMV